MLQRLLNKENRSSYCLGNTAGKQCIAVSAFYDNIREDLKKIIIRIDNSMITNEMNAPSLANISSQEETAQQIASPSNTDEFERLKLDLEGAQKECKALNEQLDRVTLDFQDACRELDLYKHEPCETALKHTRDVRLTKSRSYTELGRATIDLDEHLRFTTCLPAKFPLSFLFVPLKYLNEDASGSRCLERGHQIQSTKNI
ncbi:unnamed protein product [Gongylonema pulchrum]|uniref:t-SNARE coiled-coil homology domain-containing protein n=1 Tax=Gongylonema pulchrum TaxID=637853 RepID=A0A183EYA4_9BILA|nr:unnamed protein product [Gongylonema pulchrum]